MAIAFRSIATLAGSTASSAVVNKPASVTTNDIMVACIHVEGGDRTITAPSGWTEKDRHSPGSPDASNYIYWRRVDGSEGSTFTWSWSGSLWCEGMIAAYSGCETSGDPFDVFSEADGTGATVTASAVTTTVANTMLVLPVACWNGGSWTNSSSLNERYDGTGSNNSAWFDVAQASAGSSGAKTMTAAGGISDWIAHLLALKEPSGGGGVTVNLSSDPAAVALSAVNPTVVLGSVTVNLSTLPASAALTAVDPTVVLGSVSVNVSTLPATLALAAVDPTVTLGSVTVNLSGDPATIVLTAVDPTVSAGGNVTVDLSAAPASLALTAVDPTVVLGSVTVNLAGDPASVALTAVDPTVSVGGVLVNLAGDPATVTFSAVNPTVTLGSVSVSLADDPAALALTAVDPSVGLSSMTVSLAASPATVTLTALDPTVTIADAFELPLSTVTTLTRPSAVSATRRPVGATTKAGTPGAATTLV
jgi:hypothetical protein